MCVSARCIKAVRDRRNHDDRHWTKQEEKEKKRGGKFVNTTCLYVRK